MTEPTQKARSDAGLPFTPADPSLIEELIDTLNGRHRFLVRVAVAKTLASSIILVVCVIQFFAQETTMAMIAWATAATMCVVGLGSLTVFFWMQVDRVAISRDVKQVELQLALLAARLDQQTTNAVTREST